MAQKSPTKSAKKAAKPATKASSRSGAKAGSKAATKVKAAKAKVTTTKTAKARVAKATVAKAGTATAAPKAAARPKPAKATKAAKTAKSIAPADRLIEGQPAPAFTSPREDGRSVSLADFAGRKLVIFFYPRADTPGCTREAIDFTRLAREFAAAGTDILGVSADDQKAQTAFRAKHQLDVPLLADVDHAMIEAYGAWGEKSMYGKTFMGIVRSTVLIDANGKLIRVWRNVRVDGHADEVLEAAKSA